MCLFPFSYEYFAKDYIRNTLYLSYIIYGTITSSLLPRALVKSAASSLQQRAVY